MDKVVYYVLVDLYMPVQAIICTLVKIDTLNHALNLIMQPSVRPKIYGVCCLLKK